jgi:hypothetical protein
MTKSNSSDGRRHNRPPDKNKIGPGEIRNPFGRRGKSGVNHLSRVDEFILKEAERVVSRDESGDVTAAKRLVQEEYLAALKGKDPKARARLLNLLSQLEAKADRVQREFIMWVLECKAKYDELFYFARKRRSEPPDVMHPDHANIVDSHLVITGPVDRQSREQWENLKSLIKIAAWLHARSRQRFKLSSTEKNQAELKDIEAHRRLLMRAVPKGWDWREEIYCRYSRSKFVKNTIAILEKHP